MADFRMSKKSARILIIVAAISFFVFLTYFIITLFLKIDFLLGSGLIVHLSPDTKALNLQYGDTTAIDFNVTLETPPYCRAECSYSFIDQSKGAVIDSGEFILRENFQVSKIYNISIDKIGVGQDIYNFQVECRNIRNYLCFGREGDYTIGSSLVTVNYNLSEDLSELKNILRQNLTLFMKKLAYADIIVQNLSRNIYELGFNGDFKSLSIKKDMLNSILDSLRIDAENFHSLWSQENYIKLSEEFSQSYFDNITNLMNNAGEIKEELEENIDLHNNITAATENMVNSVKGFISIAPLIYIQQNSSKFIEKLNKVILKSNSHLSLISNNSFESYDSLEDELVIINGDLAPLINISTNSSMYNYLIGQMNLQREKDYLCLLQNNCAEIGVEKTYSDAKKFFDSGGFNDIKKVNETCSKIRDINSTFAKLRNETLESIEGGFKIEVINYAGLKKEDIINLRESKYTESFKELLENNPVFNIIEIMNSTIKNYGHEPIESKKDLEENATKYLLSVIDVSEEARDYLDEACSNLELELDFWDLETYNLPLLEIKEFSISSSLKTELSDNPSRCCVFGECRPCCNTEQCSNNPDTFPVILVHGHAVRKSNSPDYSLSSLDSIQKKLEQDGYLNAGILLNSGMEHHGEWGFSGKPVSVKVSYYFDVYKGEEGYVTVPTKSESIDTYALRLRDIIDVVKQRAGKPKVKIVAFSMGGLVARKYMQIFGDENVDKLVIIGTPHKGITGRVSGLCPVLGESKECADMEENSLFLRKINDPAKQPTNVKIYNIIGKGCFKGGKDGDGIVFAEQASLNGIVEAKEFFVNGSCSGLIPQFHTELVDVSAFPEVYGYIRDALRE